MHLFYLLASNNLVAISDPHTLGILAWAKLTGLIVCDFYFQNGWIMPFASRGILQ
ncbi:hypothetical protein [Cylindrospermum sp. FACHB-282]|uniref:hypothetical protein n=1 Tax=Cylindrospermum sp. FACHB-282 TaxID=2692794 RepID=UPI001689F21F|nr:hypothetical protein [Cylindrospermum sp. FACHB-282]MBD2385555.1 hypothetical protein [Cylindrospermum sp. FACHB-282]